MKDTDVTPFYGRRVWRELRFRVLMKYGYRCMACKRDDTYINVDHIEPISIYPELALTESNIQALCRDCHIGKSGIQKEDISAARLIQLAPEPKHAAPLYQEAARIKAAMTHLEHANLPEMSDKLAMRYSEIKKLISDAEC